MNDMGFADPAAARAAALAMTRRLRLRERLQLVEESATAVLSRFDQASQADGDGIATAIKRRIDLAQRDREGAIGGEPINQVEGNDVREEELLQGLNLVLQLLDAVREGIGQGLFSTKFQSGAERRAPVDAAHRLSEGAK